jgi:hypothetical protein
VLTHPNAQVSFIVDAPLLQVALKIRQRILVPLRLLVHLRNIVDLDAQVR